MIERQLTEALYRFVARLDDDPWTPYRVREHAHILRQEMKAIEPDLDTCLPGYELKKKP